METEEAKQLLIKYNAGECTEAEKALVESSFLEYNEYEIDILPERIAEIGEQIYEELPSNNKTGKSINLWLGIAAIAAITLLTIGSWHIFDRFTLPTERKIVQDVAPGGNKATITLANGKTINLSDTKSGVTINGNNLRYLDGAVISNVNEQDKSLVLQTLSTPKGGQYQILLSDGTKVWLNASSSVRYPISFSEAKERVVEVVGEAYFEVAPNKAKPFIVKTTTQTVEVLGTHFNINNYKDEGSTVTTLVEGSVRVINLSSHYAILKPGQQSLISGNNINVQDADIETDLAWKNGRIEFKDANIQSIMKQISRWYDIEVEFKGEIPKRTFNGGISRESNLSVLLKILEYSDIHFIIEQGQNSRKKLIVTS
jgi:transmembrane sensor